MADIKQGLNDALTQFIKQSTGEKVFPAIVTAVDETNQTIDVQDVDGNEIFNVRLKANIDGITDAMVKIPQIDSSVLLQPIGDGTQYVVIKYTQLQKVLLGIGTSTLEFTDGNIMFNGGTKNELINIDDLTGKLNDLVNEVNKLIGDFKEHQHIYIGPSGSPAITTWKPGARATTRTEKLGDQTPSTPDATGFSKEDYKDTGITH